MRWTLFCLLAAAPLIHAEVSFNRDIRPIMADTCFRCHGPDKNCAHDGPAPRYPRRSLKDHQERRHSRSCPGDPDHSAIIQTHLRDGSARSCLPSAAHKELTAAQKETIRQWVAEGAKYEGHWAYQPVQHYQVPAGQNPIDYFIQAKLDKEGIEAFARSRSDAP